MNSTGSGHKDYVLGVLFVHGMGEQKRGDTLVAAVESMLDCLRMQLKDKWHVKLDVAHLSDRESTGEPASAELEFFQQERAAPSDYEFPARWLLAESTWAGHVRAPTFVEAASWLFSAAPGAALHYAASPLARALTLARDRATVGASLREIGRTLLIAPIAFAVAALAQILVVVSVPLIVLPFDLPRKAAAALQRFVSRVLGDSQ